MLALTFYSLGTGWVEEAKNQQTKIIGDRINNSIRPNKSFQHNNYTIFSEGGYIHETLYLNSTGKEGIIICHKDLYENVFGHINIIGKIEYLEKEEIPASLKNQIKKYYNYIPDYVKFIKPKKESLEKLSTKPTTINSNYYNDLIGELKTLSRQNQLMSNTLNQMSVEVGRIIENASASIRVANKPFKKEIKQMNKV